MTLVEGLAVLIGGLLFLLGVVFFRRWQRFESADVVSAEEANTVDGGVVVEGRVREADGTVEGGISGEPCVLYSAEVQQKRGSGTKKRRGGSDGYRWSTEASSRGSVGFAVEDKSGAVVLQNPGEATLSLEAESVELADTVDSELQPEVDRDSSRKRYREERLEDGDEVSVYAGSTGMRDQGRPVLGDTRDTEMYLLSDTGVEETREKLREKALAGVFGGGLFLAIGVYGLLFL